MRANSAVDDEREEDDEDRSPEHLGVVAGLQSLEDESPEPDVGDVRREGRGGDDLQRRRPDAADDDRHAERQLDLADDLRLAHADRAGRIDRAPVDRFDPRVRTREQRRDGEDDERDDGRGSPMPSQSRRA